MSEEYTTGTGQILTVHERGECKVGGCSIHFPSNHHMNAWPTHWRSDRSLMERFCPHGIGHPDPDHLARLSSKQCSIESVHG